MKKFMLGLAVLAGGVGGSAVALAEDLEVLDPQIAQAFAQALVTEAEKIEKCQVKVQADNEKACGVHREMAGLILVPQKDLSPDTAATSEEVNKDPGAPVAHLFMSQGFSPVIDGKPLDAAKLRSIKVMSPDGQEINVSYLALAARHTDDDVWHLYAYGTDEKPILDVQIGEGAGPGTQPVALEVKDLEDNTGTAFVTLFDRFQCSFKLNYKAPEEK